MTEEDEEILKVRIAMAENDFLNSVPPETLRTMISALDYLRVRDLGKEAAIAKILQFLSIELSTTDTSRMDISRLCLIWSLYFKGDLPEYDYIYNCSQCDFKTNFYDELMKHGDGKHHVLWTVKEY